MFQTIKEKIENSSLNNGLTTLSEDGRIDSALNEDIIYEHIISLFDDSFICKRSKIRYWHDMTIEVNGQFFPINIKITKGTSADNASSKKSLFYAMTGILPEEFPGLDRWAIFNEALNNYYNPSIQSDYYYIVYFKNDNKFLFTSMKRLEKVTINSNNLPFQIKWKDNLSETTRTQEEQCKYLMNQFIIGYKSQLKGIEYLNNWENRWNGDN